MEISRKQHEALELMNDPTMIELLLGGSAGGAKTFTMCLIIALTAKQYPGARFFVGRKTLKSLKQSTINTLLTSVHPMLGISAEEGAMHWQDMVLDYANGSKIIFGELDTQPSDPDFSRLGSLEIDYAFIDEAGEITLQAKNAIRSRIGRGILSKNYGIPGKCISSCNPSQNYLRQEYYDPYIKLGGGGFQKWQIGEIEVNGVEKPAYRGFLRISAYDNPFLPQSYIDNLKTLPTRERKRLLDGNWDYVDEDNSLFKSGLFEKALSYEQPKVSEKFNKYIGVDVAGEGTDATVYSLIVNGVLTTQKKSAVQMNWQKDDARPLFRVMADELIQFAQQNGFALRDSRKIAVEVNGIGNAMRDCLKERGWFVTEYTATSKSRSEGYYQLMLDMDSGAVKVSNDLNGLDILRRELNAHSYEMDNQEPKVIKKSKLKQIIGHSPDEADSFMIANWVRNRGENPMEDARRNRNRIIF